ncbi:MAG: BrxE family protein [Deltaproteobacteria bacterium]|nr:BrxE family protein [Deltaproteobacteria bacterium]
MTEQPPVLLRMIELRFLVGALGERLAWWPSRFTDDIGLRRLATPFPRTTLRASLESVTIAARRDHDARLHPDSIHLFRLGGAQEDAIAHQLAQGAAPLQAPPRDLDGILAALDSIGAAGANGAVPVGPCSLGKVQRTRLHAGVADLARVYAAAARTGQRAVPYFEVGG